MSPSPTRALDRYWMALPLIALAIAAGAFTDRGTWLGIVALALQGAGLLFVLRTSGVEGTLLRIVQVVAIAGVVVGMASIVGGSGGRGIPQLVIGGAMAIGAPVAIVRRLRSHVRITLRTVAAALCLYLLVGQFFAFTYQLIDRIGERPFFAQTDQAGPADFTYFSFVTLTTVGYGDLTAASDGPKLLAVSEALLGQLYLVSVVALLISNLGSEPARREDRRGFRADSDASAGDPR